MKTLPALAVILLLSSGCASVVSPTVQPVTVKTVDMKGAEIRSALCRLKCGKDEYYLYTPGTVPIYTSSGELVIDCTKEGYPDGAVTSDSSANGAVFGNLIAGGVVGAVVDVGTGAAYGFAPNYQIIMGMVLKGKQYKVDDKVVIALGGDIYGVRVKNVTYEIGKEPEYKVELIRDYRDQSARVAGAPAVGDMYVVKQSEIRRRLVEE